MPASEQGVSVSKHRYKAIPRVLLFVFCQGEVLLIKGALDKKIWPGLYNGVGGHIEKSETVLQAARRELQEETSLAGIPLTLVGSINIDAGSETGILLYIFATELDAKPVLHASVEGSLHWLRLAEVTSENAVPDLPTILPLVEQALLETTPFFGRYWYNTSDQLQIEIETSREVSQ